MKPIKTPQVYIVEGSTDDRLSADRLERMMQHVRAESVRTVTLDELDQIAAAQGGCFGEPTDPHLIFTSFQWRTPAEENALQEQYPHLTGGLRRLWGGENFKVVGGFHNPWAGAICRPMWDTTPLQGCRHACAYCGCLAPGILCFLLNVEELIERNHEMMRLVPWQKNWHTGGVTDLFCFEPEYGFTKQLLDSAAQLDRYVLFYTSSDSVEFLFDLDNRDRAIIEWTISPSGLAKFETKAPPLAARLGAMKRCRDAGCTVRCQFSPLIPLPGWQEDYQAMLGELFDTVEPDLVAAHMLRCPGLPAKTLQQWFGAAALDPEYAALLPDPERDGGPRRFPGDHLFPYDARARLYRFMIDEVRRFSPDIPFALCRETPDMWDEFKDDLRLSPADCACGSGPRSRGGPGD